MKAGKAKKPMPVEGAADAGATESDAASPADALQVRRRNLPLLLLQTRERLVARFRPILHEHGLTVQQFRVLRAIFTDGPMEPRQICETCHISSPSLAGVLSRMETMGLVTRERFVNDQRRLMTSLTPASIAKFQSMQPQLDEVYEALEAQLGVAFVKEVYTMLDRLLYALR